MRGNKLSGAAIDFSHGDVDAFPPTPGSDLLRKMVLLKGIMQTYSLKN